MQKWASTSTFRVFEISKIEQRSCELILELFPALSKPDGYQLARIDFDSKFPTKSSALFDKWNEFIISVKPIIEADVTDKSGKVILSLLEGELNEGKRCLK